MIGFQVNHEILVQLCGFACFYAAVFSLCGQYAIISFDETFANTITQYEIYVVCALLLSNLALLCDANMTFGGRAGG